VHVLKRILRRPASQAVLAQAVGLYLSFALRTTRWTLIGAENLEPHALGAPAIMAAWHERLPLMPMQWLMIRRWKHGKGLCSRVHILVSHSRDGRFIAAVVRRFGIDVALGSSSRGGAVAMRHLVGLIAGGDHIGITPDGPRGPRRQAAAGVAQLAALSRVPVLPCAAQSSSHWVLHTWDHMVVPRPFGRAVIVCGPTIRVPRTGWRDAVPAIEVALTDAADRADLWCKSDRRGRH
jgi:hypothetical protein